MFAKSEVCIRLVPHGRWVRLSDWHEITASDPTLLGRNVCGAPRKLPYKPVIGELESRTEYGS